MGWSGEVDRAGRVVVVPMSTISRAVEALVDAENVLGKCEDALSSAKVAYDAAKEAVAKAQRLLTGEKLSQ